jgi:serine-type D-Ala-D-Ala carboxypeptidase/endopeptidase
VEHLARHTSGLPRSPQGLSLRAVWAAGTRGEDPYAPISTPVLLQELNRTRLRRTPGQPRIRYSNFGAGLLGLALTNVYDKATYHEMIEEVVLRPLGDHHLRGRNPGGRARVPPPTGTELAP